MKVHISKGNSKIGNKVLNISLVPIMDCGSCKLCAKKCYAVKPYVRYPKVRLAWDENSKLAHEHRAEYMRQIDAKINEKNPEWFRWHIAGDILDQDYLDSMVEIAIKYPTTKFLCFTKMHMLDFSNLPKNLSVVISRWAGDTVGENKCGLPYAWVQDGSEDRIPKNAVVCAGGCEGCMVCWNLKDINRDVYFNIH